MNKEKKTLSIKGIIFQHGEKIALILILILAGFFRFWKLDIIPPGLYPDEAINAMQGALEPLRIFYQENNGREGLLIAFLKLSIDFSGKPKSPYMNPSKLW